MAHAQKPDFVFRAKRTSPFKSARWASVQSTAGSRGVRIGGSNAGYTMFRGSVKGTGYPLHSTVSPSLPLPCVTVCHHISTGFRVFSEGKRAEEWCWRLTNFLLQDWEWVPATPPPRLCSCIDTLWDDLYLYSVRNVWLHYIDFHENRNGFSPMHVYLV